MAGGPDIEIRAARDADAADLAALCNLVGARAGGPGDAMTAEIVRRDVLAPDSPLGALVAAIGGETAGMALHLPAYETAFAERGRYLQDIAVFDRFRRRGVARALIARLARLTRDEGGGFLWWMNMDAMEEGRALYRRIADIEDEVRSFAVTRDRFQALADEDR